jgi:hypothetical protein
LQTLMITGATWVYNIPFPFSLFMLVLSRSWHLFA